MIRMSGDYTLSLVNVLLNIAQCLLLTAVLLTIWKDRHR